jgi:large conductance mechanosensitive channel
MSMDEKMLNELKKIREAVEAKPAPPAPEAPKGLWNEFKAFLKKYGVLGLAIAFIMGLYLGGLVQSLVKDLLLPLIGLAFPGMGDLASLSFAVGSQTFGIGNFLVALITFIIVAFVIFLIVKITKKWGLE